MAGSLKFALASTVLPFAFAACANGTQHVTSSGSAAQTQPVAADAVSPQDGAAPVAVAADGKSAAASAAQSAGPAALDLGGATSLTLPGDWTTNATYAGTGYTRAGAGGSEALLTNFGTSLFLGNTTQVGWYVYLTGIDHGAHTAICSPLDGSTPRVGRWDYFHNKTDADAAQVLNLCLEGLFAAGGSSWTLEIPPPTPSTSDPTYYLASQLVVQHPVTLRTQNQIPGDTTSCYHTATEHHSPSWAGTRNYGGGIYWNGTAYQTYPQGMTCVHLVAAPCANCGLPSPQFFNVDPNSPNGSTVMAPAVAPAASQKMTLINHGLNGAGMVLAGHRDFSEAQNVILQNLIFDGNRNARNVEWQCAYHKYYGTQNLGMIHCRNCELLGSASVNNLCGVNVQLDMVGGAVDYNTVAASGGLGSTFADEQQSDGLTGWSIQGTDVGVNTLMDATDGNSFFAANGAKFHDSLVTNANPANPQGLNHSGFNFNGQVGTRFGAEVVPGDFRKLQVFGNTVLGNYHYNTSVRGSQYNGSKVGIELGTLPWSPNQNMSSDFTGAKFWNNFISGVIFGYGLDGIGVIGSTSSVSFPSLCNGVLSADGTVCTAAKVSQIKVIAMQSTNPAAASTYVPQNWYPNAAELTLCHSVPGYQPGGQLASFTSQALVATDGNDQLPCSHGPY